MAKKKKRILRKFSEMSGKLQIDRFFEVLRSKYNIYAFQNEGTARYDFFNDNQYKFVVTLKPKRDFFVDDENLIEDGFEIEYHNVTKEDFANIEYEVKRHFGSLYFYKFIKADTRKEPNNEKLSGKILFKNFKKKEIENER